MVGAERGLGALCHRGLRRVEAADCGMGISGEAARPVNPLVAPLRNWDRSGTRSRWVETTISSVTRGEKMMRGTGRILTTHAGALPRPQDLWTMIVARASGQAYDREALPMLLRGAVAEVVRKQLECGLDSINDGELSKTSFTSYVRERLSGFESRDTKPGEGPKPLSVMSRDMKRFAEYFTGKHGGFGWVGFRAGQVFCTGPLKYVGHAALREDLDNFKAALAGARSAEAFLPANTPGTIEHWLRNEYYANDEEFLYAIAEAMREEYQAIVDAGFLLQIDDPDLPDGWQMYPEMSVRDYRKYATLRVDALNHALRGIPQGEDPPARLLGELPRPAPGRHPLARHRRHHLSRARRELFDRGLQPRARARMGSVQEGEAAAGRGAHPRSRRPLLGLHRAPGARRRSAWRATRSSSAGTTSWPGPTAAWVRASAIRTSPGPSSRRWSGARTWRAGSSGRGARSRRSSCARREEHPGARPRLPGGRVSSRTEKIPRTRMSRTPAPPERNRAA